MYIEGENPAMSDPDLQHARQALAKLEHLVVQDLFVTETAFHADVILPASAFAEKDGTFTNTDRRVQLARQVIKPPGDARQDLWIIQEIGKRMGLPLELFRPRRRLRRDGGADAVAQEHHLGAAGARRRRDLSGRRSEQARQRDHLHHGLPDRERPRQDRAGRRPAAGRAARRRISDGAVDRPRARALAHRLDDPPRPGARPDRAGGGRLHVAEGHAQEEARARRFHPARDPPRRGRGQGPRRPRRAGEHGVHAVLLRGGGGQPADQSGARSVRQDPGVQVLRGPGRARGDAGRGGVAISRKTTPCTVERGLKGLRQFSVLPK